MFLCDIIIADFTVDISFDSCRTVHCIICLVVLLPTFNTILQLCHIHISFIPGMVYRLVTKLQM
jgi:hypothetical protein